MLNNSTISRLNVRKGKKKLLIAIKKFRLSRLSLEG